MTDRPSSLLTIAITATALLSAPAHYSATASEIEGSIEGVEGDTLVVGTANDRVCLCGIDAPEGRPRCRDGNGARYPSGNRFAQVRARILGRTAVVSCNVLDRGRYGRAVGECRLVRGAGVAGTNINRSLVREGWVLDDDRFSDRRYAGAASTARRRGGGLWQGDFIPPGGWRKG